MRDLKDKRIQYVMLSASDYSDFTRIMALYKLYYLLTYLLTLTVAAAASFLTGHILLGGVAESDSAYCDACYRCLSVCTYVVCHTRAP